MAAITDKTRKMLWGRSGGVCAICKKQLFEDEVLSDDPSVLGQECHIVGEENTAKSPRGLNPMPLADRNLFDNLILLCRDHHKIIDDQPEKYTIDELHRIKNEHIIWVRQTLGYDEAKQQDDETYLSIAQQWSELAGLDDWDNFTYLIIEGDSPSVKKDRLSQLDSLCDWLFKRIYPNRYLQLNDSFENFRRILNDFLSEFSRHRKWQQSEDDRYVETEKFYQIDEWNEEKFNRLLKQYEDHGNLLSDLACELTRAANYICDLMRAHVYRLFRIHEGVLVVRTGTGLDGSARARKLAYASTERQGIPYSNLNDFKSVRTTRDYHFGPVKD